MKIILRDVEKLMEMANVRGKNVVTDKINFSFYFSSKAGMSHGIRVKICWNPNRIGDNVIDGYMELHGDYEYISSPNPVNSCDSKDVKLARTFFKKYKVLFSAVWELVLDPPELQDYFRKLISFSDMLKEFHGIDKDVYEAIQFAKSLQELESIVRKTNAFNMND